MPGTIRERTAASVVDRGRVVPRRGCLRVFSPARPCRHVPRESSRSRVAGDILVACLFARIAREPTRDGSYSATGLTDGGHRGDALLRRVRRVLPGPPHARPGAAGGTAATGTATGEQPRFYRWWCGTSAFASGAPVDPMVEEYLMAHYARAFEAAASRGEGFPRGDGRGPRRVWKIRIRRRGGGSACGIGSRARGRATRVSDVARQRKVSHRRVETFIHRIRWIRRDVVAASP